MKRSFSRENYFVALLLLIGAILRLRQYFTGRSLWLDEAMLALNIVNRNFAGMFQPLEYNQGAPIGFLLIEKFFNALLGRNEMVLRLFPIIAGLASVWLFYLLLKQVTNRAGVIVGLALFAVNPQLIYYSSESKQYIVDVAVTIGLLVFAMPILNQKANKKEYLILGLAGVLALWLSHPALFILAGIGLVLLIQVMQKRDWNNMHWVVMIGVLWAINFISLYFINLRKLSSNSFLTAYWSDTFMPMPPWNHLAWFSTYMSESIRIQLGIVYAVWLVAICIAIGWLVLYRERYSTALIILFITFFAFVASALRLYPVLGRLALFSAPLGIVLLSKTVEWLQKVLIAKKLTSTIITLTLSGFLIYSPLITSTQLFITPKYFEHIRPFMDYLASTWKDGDSLFLSYGAEPAFLYYRPFYHLEHVPYVASQYSDYPDQEKLKARIAPLLGKKRVWILISHVYQLGSFNEKDFWIDYLSSIGKQTRQMRIPDTSVYLYLYDLSK